MCKPYYLFQMDEDGAIIAINKVLGLDQVKEQLTKLTAIKPGLQYLIYDPIAAQFVEPFKKSAFR